MRGAEALAAIAEDALARARRAGAEAAEVYLTESHSRHMKAIGNFVEAKEGRDEGIGIRVAINGHLGHSGVSGLTDHNIDAVIVNALESVRGVSGRGSCHGFAEPGTSPPAPIAPHPALIEPDPERLTTMLDTMMAALRDAPKVTFYAAKVATVHRRFLVANSNGLVAWDESASESAEVSARATGSGAERTANASWTGSGPMADSVRIVPFAESVAANARDALAARPLERPVDQVVLAPQAAAQILGLMTAAFSGARVARDQSPLAGRIGERIACETFTLRDEPHGPAGSARFRIDHEGVPSQPLTLVEQGVVAEFAYDTATAHAEGRTSNGHGLRASLGGAVLPRVMNPVVSGGDHRLDELLEEIDRAVLVTDQLMGAIGSNNTTGDFSLVAPYAFLVEDGERKHALPPTTVGGNVYTVIRELRALSKETESVPGGTYPTIHTGGIACAT